MQEDMWDSDWDLHENLFKAWTEIKENSSHRLNAVFEVDTDLQKGVQLTVTAEMVWPSILSSPRQLSFPLTNTNSSSVSYFVDSINFCFTDCILNRFF